MRKRGGTPGGTPKRKAPPPDSAPTRLLKPEDVAREFQISRASVYRLIADGDLPSVNVGKRNIRVPFDSLVAWIKKQESGG